MLKRRCRLLIPGGAFLAVVVGGCMGPRPMIAYKFAVPTTLGAAEKVRYDRLPVWGVGISAPIDLLQRYELRPNHPPYCKEPDQFLSELDRIINSDQLDARGCSSQSTTAPGSWRMLRIQCTMQQPTKQCQDRYLAFVWTERQSASTNSYGVKAFGWVARACVQRDLNNMFGPPLGEDTLTELFARRSRKLQEFLGRCNGEVK